MALENHVEDVNPYSLISQSRQFAHGTAQRADLLDRAISAADRSGSVQARFDARRSRFSSAVFGGEAELGLALFAWCQHMADDRPDIISPSALLWDYKHVLMELPKFARISQWQIDAISAEMAKRYEANGASLRPVYAKRSEAASHQGKTAQARALWDQAMRHPRDRYADCAACELSYSLHLLALENRCDELLAAASPILAGTMHCAEVPHTVLPRVMLALSATGQQAQARKLRAQSYRLIRSNPDFIEEVALHIEFLVSERELAQAAQIAVRHLPWLRIATSDKMQLHYVRALHCLLLAAGRTPIGTSKWRQPLFDALEAVYGLAPEGADLAGRLELLTSQVAKAGLALAAALDQRNDNDYFQRLWKADAFTVTEMVQNI